jgi:hypothetical protein
MKTPKLMTEVRTMREKMRVMKTWKLMTEVRMIMMMSTKSKFENWKLLKVSSHQNAWDILCEELSFILLFWRGRAWRSYSDGPEPRDADSCYLDYQFQWLLSRGGIFLFLNRK